MSAVSNTTIKHKIPVYNWYLIFLLGLGALGQLAFTAGILSDWQEPITLLVKPSAPSPIEQLSKSLPITGWQKLAYWQNNGFDILDALCSLGLYLMGVGLAITIDLRHPFQTPLFYRVLYAMAGWVLFFGLLNRWWRTHQSRTLVELEWAKEFKLALTQSSFFDNPIHISLFITLLAGMLHKGYQLQQQQNLTI